MEENQEHEKACERYLLGELSDQEQTRLEEAYFNDDALFERFCAVKDDLIDAYARGALTGTKRERFEQHFLASELRREQVEEARGFIRAATAASANTSAEKTTSANTVVAGSWWQSISRLFASRPLVWQGGLAVLLLVALAGSWMLVRRMQSRRERAQNEEAARRLQEQKHGRAVVPSVNGGVPTNPSASPTPATPPTPKTDDRQPEQSALVASLSLTPFSPRDATASNSLLLRPDTAGVRLRLAFTGDDYRRYDAVLRTIDGQQVLTRHGLKASASSRGKGVTLTLDASALSHQDYIVTLSGLTAAGKVEAIGDYYFRVQRSAPQSTSSPDRK